MATNWSLTGFSYVTRRIQKYGGDDFNDGIWPDGCVAGDAFPAECEDQCDTRNISPNCKPTTTFRGDYCIWTCTIDPLGDWASVPECSIQIKYFFIAKDNNGVQHDIIWEANVDMYARVNWTYACLDRCNPPNGNYDTYDVVKLQACSVDRSLNTGSCTDRTKPHNFCANRDCGCFACDEDALQHFVTKNAW